MDVNKNGVLSGCITLKAFENIPEESIIKYSVVVTEPNPPKELIMRDRNINYIRVEYNNYDLDTFMYEEKASIDLVRQALLDGSHVLVMGKDASFKNSIRKYFFLIFESEGFTTFLE